MTATDDENSDSADATARLEAEALTDEGAFDKLMARGNITAVPTAVAGRLIDWEGLTPAEETEARRKEIQEREEYAREMELVRERAEELRERLDEQEQETRKKIAEADSRAIVLGDGRRVLVGRNGDYIDEASGRKLDGADKTEAASERQANSETEEEHKALRDRLAQIDDAKSHLQKADDLAANGKNLSATERNENAAQAQSELATAEAATHEIAYVDAGSSDQDMAAVLGLTADQKGRTASFAASLDSRDAQPRTARAEFAEVANEKKPVASEPGVAQGLNTLSDSVSRVEVIQVHQQYKAESRIVIPKCFRKVRAQMMRFGKLLAVPETLSLILFQKTPPSPLTAAGRYAGRLFRRPAAIIAGAILAAILMGPSTAWALSIREYENLSRTERADKAADAIDKIVADVARVNPELSRAIHDYFYIIPKGQPESPGLIAFEGDLLAIERAADQGKADLDKMQIEGILLGVVKRDVVSKQPEKK
jgi:hypothetical protein